MLRLKLFPDVTGEPRLRSHGRKREIGFCITDNARWLLDDAGIYPWIDSNTSGDWWVIRPLDFLLGKRRYSKENLTEESAFVMLPEGAYPAWVQLYTAVWKRPRWPWARRVPRANVAVTGGVPIPGKGDNGRDMDAIHNVAIPAATTAEAVEMFAEIVWRERKRHAGINWTPATGWPAHLIPHD